MSERGNASGPPDLDARRLEGLLDGRLWRAGAPRGAVAGLRTLYSSADGERTSLVLEVALRDARGPSRQIYSGRIVPPRAFEDACRRAAEAATVSPARLRAVVEIPEASLVLLAYPNDPRMRLLDQEGLEAWSERHLAELAGRAAAVATARVESAALEVLRYVPGRRWTARCRLTLDIGGGRRKRLSFVAKQFGKPKAARRLARHLRSLRLGDRGAPPRGAGRGALRNGAAFRVPRLLAVDGGRGVVFLEALPGVSLERTLGRIPVDRLVPGAGALLADFHRGSADVRKRVRPERELAELRESARAVRGVLPGLGPRLGRVIEALSDARRRPASRDALLHGSFRPNHLMAHRGRLSVLDLDSLRLGPPAYDLANWIASLYYLEAEGRLGARGRRRIARRLLEGYARNAAWDVPGAEVLWFVADLLVQKQALKCATRIRDHRALRTDAMVSLAEEAARLARRSGPGTSLAGVWKVLP